MDSTILGILRDIGEKLAVQISDGDNFGLYWEILSPDNAQDLAFAISCNILWSSDDTASWLALRIHEGSVNWREVRDYLAIVIGEELQKRGWFSRKRKELEGNTNASAERTES
jgi:hypothetical protein